MPALAAEFTRDVQRTLALAHFAELALLDLPTGSAARRELTPIRVWAIYEMTYLRLFVRWEVFLEQTFLRLICDYSMPNPGHGLDGTPYALVGAPFRTLEAADLAVIGTHDFVSWARPDHVIDRSRTFLTDGPHDLVLSSVRVRMRWWGDVRNRVAHSSQHARRLFDVATVSIAGGRYPAASPGRFLRDWNVAATPGERWLWTFASELTGLAQQIAP